MGWYEKWAPSAPALTLPGRVFHSCCNYRWHMTNLILSPNPDDMKHLLLQRLSWRGGEDMLLLSHQEADWHRVQFGLPFWLAQERRCVTHHNRDMKNVQLLLHNLRRLLQSGRRHLGELLRAAHGNVEVEGAIFQPPLLPVHQGNVRHCSWHLYKTKGKQKKLFISLQYFLSV